MIFIARRRELSMTSAWRSGASIHTCLCYKDCRSFLMLLRFIRLSSISFDFRMVQPFFGVVFDGSGNDFQPNLLVFTFPSFIHNLFFLLYSNDEALKEVKVSTEIQRQFAAFMKVQHPSLQYDGLRVLGENWFPIFPSDQIGSWCECEARTVIIEGTKIKNNFWNPIIWWYRSSMAKKE